MVIPLFFELFLMATGCALISDIFVRFRDLGQVWEVLLQAGLYATPIIYPITFIADRNPWAAKLVMMNPLAPNYSRHAILLDLLIRPTPQSGFWWKISPWF